MVNGQPHLWIRSMGRYVGPPNHAPAHPPQEKQFGSIDDHPVRMAMTDDSMTAIPFPLSDSERDEEQRAIIDHSERFACLPFH